MKNMTQVAISCGLNNQYSVILDRAKALRSSTLKVLIEDCQENIVNILTNFNLNDKTSVIRLDHVESLFQHLNEPQKTSLYLTSLDDFYGLFELYRYLGLDAAFGQRLTLIWESILATAVNNKDERNLAITNILKPNVLLYGFFINRREAQQKMCFALDDYKGWSNIDEWAKPLDRLDKENWTCQSPINNLLEIQLEHNIKSKQILDQPDVKRIFPVSENNPLYICQTKYNDNIFGLAKL